MKYHAIFLKRTHPGQPDPDLMVKTFDTKLELLQYVAENHIAQRGPRAFRWITGGTIHEGGIGDIYAEIEQEKLKNTEEVVSGKT